MNDEISKLIKISPEGILLPCHIQPGASKNAFKGIHGESLKFAISAPPVEGKANAGLKEFLAKKLSVSKSSVDIVSGESSRIKRVFLKNVSLQDLLKAFSE